MMVEYSLPYAENSATLFARVADEPWAIFLDSGRPGSLYGRYDIIVARPFMTINSHDGLTEITNPEGTQRVTGDPFLIVKELLQEYPVQSHAKPFAGGAVGYFSYDLGRVVEHLPAIARDAEHIPQLMIGFYDWALIVDHCDRQAKLVSHGVHPDTAKAWPELCALFENGNAKAQLGNFEVMGEVRSNLDERAYASAFDKIKRYILEGDCYQVNLAQRFSATAQGNGWIAYQQLRALSPAPFMSYLNLPDVQVLSGSPERFLQVSGKHVETRPIKGTRPRSGIAADDANNAAELLSSEKDRAENLMIVDLLRNDIGKSCSVGSVKADRLFALESFANVHHMVSTVTGQLAPGATAVDLLRGCFPGGSITGAPKLRAMEIIEELEPHRRGIYCGAIGYIGFDGNMDTNIAIRTAVYSRGEMRFWAGGGIVADSEMQKEYRETWDKASSMLALASHFRKHD